MDDLIVAQGITKEFYQGKGSSLRVIPVLRGVDLTVAPGEMLSIVGRSGSGKSTLLHCLSGLETITSGSVVIRGSEVSSMRGSAIAKIRSKHLGFIFQSYNLIPSLTVKENIVLPAYLAGMPLSNQQVERVLESVGLDFSCVRKMPSELSGGEQQRVSIARVMAKSPDVVFADEPTGALDAANGRKVLDMLRSAANGRRSVVMVTHDLEAASLADRVLIIHDGLILSELSNVTPHQILEKMGEIS
ncbi:ABC transporter ATP-binding protein [Eggerthellaceae bacterium zg-1084]|uniref:ABC transporter ATP-binding protein n=1 Tax=Berryella wangjianweii TaxID=2734634 RepID=UPI001553972E|nr:ABC transporter ATP-binding protein [Berryella wangjianweii]NPD30430.1 ABC transporter ATP-binding protein [Berryella wangjianweii]